MLSKNEILQLGKKTFELEANALNQISSNLDITFASAVELILSAKGRVAVTGIGKSAIIGMKISATFNSTGTPSFFMHAADAVHGDLGMVQEGDVIIVISKSGNSPEIKALVPLLRNFHIPVIGIVGNSESFLAKHSDIELNTYVDQEACPNNLAPTTSTTAQMAMGDAIAVALLSCRNFKSEDFAKYHPGGALGKRLYLKLEDIAIKNIKPSVSSDTPFVECLVSISESRLGATIVLDGQKILGIITDGDIRRALHKQSNTNTLLASDLMTANPKTIEANSMASDGLEYLKKYKINHLVLVQDNAYAGLVHLQNIIEEGII